MTGRRIMTQERRQLKRQAAMETRAHAAAMAPSPIMYGQALTGWEHGIPGNNFYPLSPAMSSGPVRSPAPAPGPRPNPKPIPTHFIPPNRFRK